MFGADNCIRPFDSSYCWLRDINKSVRNNKSSARLCAWQREIDNSIFQVIFFLPVLAAVVQTSSFSLLCDKGWHNARMKLLFKCFPLYGQTSIPGWYDWKADVWLSIIYLSRELKVMCTFPISSHQSPSNAELLSASAIMLLS